MSSLFAVVLRACSRSFRATSATSRSSNGLTLSLFAYVATVLVVDVPWGEVAYRHAWSRSCRWQQDYIVAIVAVLGTTISPYLFFWQASEEAEDERDRSGRSIR